MSSKAHALSWAVTTQEHSKLKGPGDVPILGAGPGTVQVLRKMLPGEQA